MVFALMFAGISTDAAEPLALYDDFNARLIDPDKWRGAELNHGPLGTELIRQIQGKRLRLAYRGYGFTSSDSGNTFHDMRLIMTPPSTITAVAATVEITKVQAKGCSRNPIGTEALGRLYRFFFKTESPTPGEVWAGVLVRRSSQFTDPPNVLQVSTNVEHCIDHPEGRSCISLGGHDLGPIPRGERVKLGIQWDSDNDQFLFQRDAQPKVSLPYTVPDTGPAEQHIFLGHGIGVPNCTTASRPVGFIEAQWDDVFVNESAAPQYSYVECSHAGIVIL